VVEENIFCQKGFAGTRFFGRFVEQYIIIDHDADIPGEDEIGDRGEQQAFVVRGAADKRSGQPNRVQVLQSLLDFIGAGFDSAYGGDELQLDIIVFQYIGQQRLKLDHFVRPEKAFVARFIEGAPVPFVIDLREPALYPGGSRK